MSLSLPDILTAKWPGVRWDYRGDQATPYDGLTWHGPGEKPTLEAIEAAGDELEAELAARKIWADGEAFLRSFTLEEQGALALSTDPTIAALRMLITARKGEVWSDNAEVQYGMAALVTAGIITEERKTEILTP